MIEMSVIVPTFNRSGSLKKMLESFFLQEFNSTFNYELIVVDNNSKDNTRECINSFIKQKGDTVRYILEAKQGKTNALNTGVANARGQILVFTDDDVLIDKHWLANISSSLGMNEYDAMGGKVLPQYPVNTPDWIKDCKDILNGPIVYYDYGDTARKYDHSMLPFLGANIVIKTAVFKDSKGFNPNLGPGTGTMGDDTAFFRELEKSGKNIFYDPNVLVIHPVEESRMNLAYFAKWNMAMGKYYALKDLETAGLVKYFGIPRYLFLRVMKISFSLVFSLFNRRKFIQLWQDLFINIGMIKTYKNNKILINSKA